MDCSPPGSSVHGILQARILEGAVMPSSRASSQSRDQTHVSCLLHWQVGFLPLAPPGGKPWLFIQREPCKLILAMDCLSPSHSEGFRASGRQPQLPPLQQPQGPGSAQLSDVCSTRRVCSAELLAASGPHQGEVLECSIQEKGQGSAMLPAWPSLL